jgi:hypothetical protein
VLARRLALILLLLLSPALAQANSTPLTLSLVASDPGPIATGNLLEVEIWVSGLTAGGSPSLGNFDIDLSFDGGVLSAQSVVFGSELAVSPFGSLQTSFLGAGLVQLEETAFAPPGDLDASQGSSFVLATLSFLATAAGTTGIDFAAAVLGDGFASPFTNLTFEPLDLTVVVPEPAVLPLLALGFAALGAARRTSRRL